MCGLVGQFQISLCDLALRFCIVRLACFFCEHLHSSISSFFVRALVSIRLVLHSGIGDADGWLASVNLLPGQPDLFVALLVGECAEVENCCSHRTSTISLDPETLI